MYHQYAMHMHMHMHVRMHMHMPACRPWVSHEAHYPNPSRASCPTPHAPCTRTRTPPPPSQARDASHPTPGELRGVQNQLSNFGDDRPISAVAFSPGSGLCATGSWSHMVKIWSVPDCKQVAALPSQ